MLSLVLSTPALLLSPRAAPRVARSPSVSMATGNDAISFPELDGSDVRVGIITARWHDEINGNLIAGAKESLKKAGVKEENIVEREVPGSFELPLACRFLALSGTVDCILPIGTLIKGDTYHFEVISESVTKGLMDVGLSTGVPVVFGVLTANTEEQAKARSEGKNNHGLQWGSAAVEMALLRNSALGKMGKGKLFMGFGEEKASSGAKAVPGGAPAKVGF
jgi:6,7-dimethyl-8-ribityllumazine synthase